MSNVTISHSSKVHAIHCYDDYVGCKNEPERSFFILFILKIVCITAMSFIP
jgi:hypothetical protein